MTETPPHYCDICETPFHSLDALADHDCEREPDVATDGGTVPPLRDHPAVADAAHLVVRGQGPTSSKVVHLPDEADPDRPACRHADDGHWWQVAPDRVPEDYRLCQYCDPEYEIDRAGHSGGNALRAKLLDMDADEIGGDTEHDVATDGGTSMDETERTEPCQGCGEPVDTLKPGNWKAPNDEQWWHEECYNKVEKAEELAKSIRGLMVPEGESDGLSDEFHDHLDNAQAELELAVERERLKRDQDLVTDGGETCTECGRSGVETVECHDERYDETVEVCETCVESEPELHVVTTDGGTECNCIIRGDHSDASGVCNEESPEGNLCSKPTGHDGPHAACNAATHPVEVWRDEDEVATDGAGVSLTALTMFQFRCLRAIRRLERADVEKLHGLAIKEALEDDYGEEVHHGRLYPNLDEMVDWGLVEKGNIDSRTNSYALTQAGRDLLEHELQTFARDLGLVVYDANAQARPDGGEQA